MFPLRDNVVGRGSAVMIWVLIVLNIAVFLTYGTGDAERYQQVVYGYGTIPAVFAMRSDFHQAVGPWTTLITSMFLHGGWLHLLGNLYFLYIFGDNVEDRLGSGSFLGFYLLVGIIGGLTHIFFNLQGPGFVAPAIGASGAISGILGAYLVMFPQASIRTLVTFVFIQVIDIPAIFFLGFWFISQFFLGADSGVAFMAHVGGFIAGALLALVWPKDPRAPVEYDDFSGHQLERGAHYA